MQSLVSPFLWIGQILASFHLLGSPHFDIVRLKILISECAFVSAEF